MEGVLLDQEDRSLSLVRDPADRLRSAARSTAPAPATARQAQQRGRLIMGAADRQHLLLAPDKVPHAAPAARPAGGTSRTPVEVLLEMRRWRRCAHLQVS